MRELKFRVYDKTKQKMFDVMCFYSNEQVEYRDGFTIVKLNKNDGDDFVVIQYTGFEDKNGKEIYEGDIVRYNDEYTAVVAWKHTGFVLELLDDKKTITIVLWCDIESREKIEVIGNIYENLELVILLSDDI